MRRPSGAAVIAAGSIPPRPASTPSRARIASRPGSSVQRLIHSDEGSIRLAIRRRPSVIVARSSRAPDQPRETSGARSATSPASAKASAAEWSTTGAVLRGGAA